MVGDQEPAGASLSPLESEASETQTHGALPGVGLLGFGFPPEHRKYLRKRRPVILLRAAVGQEKPCENFLQQIFSACFALRWFSFLFFFLISFVPKSGGFVPFWGCRRSLLSPGCLPHSFQLMAGCAGPRLDL